MNFGYDLDTINVHHYTKFGDHKSNGFRAMNFSLVTFVQSEFWSRQTSRRTETDAYKPTVLMHRCAQKRDLSFFFHPSVTLGEFFSEQVKAYLGKEMIRSRYGLLFNQISVPINCPLITCNKITPSNYKSITKSVTH